MLVAPKYEGLDLPIHDPETPLAIRSAEDGDIVDQVEKISRGYVEPTVVRAMMISLYDLSHAPDSAAELLEKTDRELARVAELCGALVAGYEWGLYPVDAQSPRFRRYVPSQQGLGGIINLPRNHILVAEVDVIKPVMADEADGSQHLDAEDSIRVGVNQYYREGSGTYQLYDMKNDYGRAKTEQFLRGTAVKAPDDPVATHLVDIEPRFTLTR